MFCSCSLLYVFGLFVCFVSSMFHSLLSIWCNVLFMCCFCYVCLCLKSELCCVLVLCVCYVSVLCFSIFFLLCFCLKLVYVLFFYVSVMIVMLICFLLCFFYVSILLCNDFLFYMYYVEFWFVFFCVSAGFLFICQHQFCFSIWQSLEFAKPVGIWVGKSATSVPSLSGKNILDKYWPVQNTGQ